ncbi:MAG TPA: hypothetical protein D7I01_01200, partial [Candidatus Poseidoniales archaeon]
MGPCSKKKTMWGRTFLNLLHQGAVPPDLPAAAPPAPAKVAHQVRRRAEALRVPAKVAHRVRRRAEALPVPAKVAHRVRRRAA